MTRTESDYKASLARFATALAVVSPVRAKSMAETWRRQGYTYDADLLDREIAFWQSAFKVGFAEAIEDAGEASNEQSPDLAA